VTKFFAFAVMFPLPLSFILLSCWSLVNAGSANNGEPCKTGDNRLQIGTYQFFGTCNSVTYCAEDTQTCTLKTCRKDDFPFGYVKGGPKVPPKCGDDEFCPDEGSGCQAKFDPGVKCQFNRDGRVGLFPACTVHSCIFSQINANPRQTQQSSPTPPGAGSTGTALSV
jgi:hypothetical protein